jgi:hypothetical protein
LGLAGAVFLFKKTSFPLSASSPETRSLQAFRKKIDGIKKFIYIYLKLKEAFMIRFDLKLLPVDENAKDSKVIEAANAEAKHAYEHLKKLIGKRKCRKHPSSPNKLRIFAVKGAGPRAELVAYCCPDFIKRLK